MILDALTNINKFNLNANCFLKQFINHSYFIFKNILLKHVFPFAFFHIFPFLFHYIIIHLVAIVQFI